MSIVDTPAGSASPLLGGCLIPSATVVNYPGSTPRVGANSIALCIDHSYCPYFRTEIHMCQKNDLQSCRYALLGDCVDDCCHQYGYKFKYKFYSDFQQSSAVSECFFESLENDAFGLSQNMVNCSSNNFTRVYSVFGNINDNTPTPNLWFSFRRQIDEGRFWQKGGGSIWVAKFHTFGFVSLLFTPSGKKLIKKGSL